MNGHTAGIGLGLSQEPKLHSGLLVEWQEPKYLMHCGRWIRGRATWTREELTLQPLGNTAYLSYQDYAVCASVSHLFPINHLSFPSSCHHDHLAASSVVLLAFPVFTLILSTMAMGLDHSHVFAELHLSLSPLFLASSAGSTACGSWADSGTFSACLSVPAPSARLFLRVALPGRAWTEPWQRSMNLKLRKIL